MRGHRPGRQELETYAARVRGSLLGGAIGDALGGPVEFWDLARIRREVGPEGVRGYVPETVDGRTVHGRITDDTQMTLFTVEGMIRASVRTDRGLGFTTAVLHRAYDRWLDTQLLPAPRGEPDGWLAQEPWLYSRRAPGTTCLTALEAARRGRGSLERAGEPARNDSKGCGGVMRSAPFGLTAPWGSWTPETQFRLAAEAAGYTHGHPTGMLASGALAAMVGCLVRGQDLTAAVDETLRLLAAHDGHEETVRALEAAVAASRQGPDAALVESLGGGWVAEEALAIATYAALVHPGPDQVLDALSLAVTHSGDSDSTGAICGNVLGALHGDTALPVELVFEVEGRATLLTLADDLVLECTAGDRLHGDHGPWTRWTWRYPGG